MYFNEEFETLPRPALEALQLKRLQSTLERVYANVPFYKTSLDSAGIKPADINLLKTCSGSPLLPSRICAIPTPTDSLQRLWKKLFVSMLPAERPVNQL